MFHVKHRFIGLLLIALSMSFAIACGAGTGPRGWAAPVQTADNLLLISTSRGHLDAVDSQTRDRKWRFPDDWSVSGKGAGSLKGIYGEPAVSSDGRVIFVAGYNGYVYAFRPSDLASSGDDKP